MRNRERAFGLGQTRIEDVKISVKSRDDIPALLIGLQGIYRDEGSRERVFELLKTHVAPHVAHDMGRPGMDLWPILVLGVLKVGLDCDWDRVELLANEMPLVRAMMGLGTLDEGVEFERQTVIDNVSLLTPQLLKEVSDMVARKGGALARKKPGEPLRGRVDSFVVETDARHPTDVSLLWDAMRVALRTIGRLTKRHGLKGWRQHRHLSFTVKRLFNRVRRSSDWRRPDRVRPYLNRCRGLVARMRATEAHLPLADVVESGLGRMLDTAERLIDQVDRRLLRGERIPHGEKIFSVFEPHTRWIAKGKAKAPVELGVPVALMQDQHGFVLGSLIQWRGGDVDAAAPLVDDVLARHPRLEQCTFDRGFHSPDNQRELARRLGVCACPVKGYRDREAKRRESEPEFRRLRRWHAGVESAINHLEHHGLARVRDHGPEAFERNVALAVLAANLHVFGVLLRNRERERRRRARSRTERHLPLAA